MQEVEYDLEGFPRLNYDYLRLKTLGTYQVRLYPRYVQDTTNRNPNNEFIRQTQLFEPGLKCKNILFSFYSVCETFHFYFLP